MAFQLTYRYVMVFSLLLSGCLAGDDRTFLDPLGNYCHSDAPVFKKLVDKTLSQITDSTQYSPYINVTAHEKDKYVYGLAQCRIDVEPAECSMCINAAVKALVHDCKYQSDGRIWYDWCTVRYSTTNFIGTLDTKCYTQYQNPIFASWDGFGQTLYNLFVKNIGSQIVKPWNQGFGKAVAQLDDYNSLYGLAQCTKDLTLYLSADMALQALIASVQQFQQYCQNSIGCRVVTSSCYVRYEIYPFFIPYKSKNNSTSTAKAVTTQSSP